MQALSIPQLVAVWALPVLLAITLHEVAHGWVADRLGDGAARLLGRLSLNPLRHVDPIGTLLVPGVLLAASGFVFGWARPVPVNPRNLRRPRRDMAWIALAGPLANLAMALAWVVVARLALVYHQPLGDAALFLVLMGAAGVLINTVLFVLNLLPLPPLDGGRVLTSLLPPAWARHVARVERFGILIVVVLLVTGALGYVLSPIMSLVIGSLSAAAGLPAEVYGMLQ